MTNVNDLATQNPSALQTARELRLQRLREAAEIGDTYDYEALITWLPQLELIYVKYNLVGIDVYNTTKADLETVSNMLARFDLVLKPGAPGSGRAAEAYISDNALDGILDELRQLCAQEGFLLCDRLIDPRMYSMPWYKTAIRIWEQRWERGRAKMFTGQHITITRDMFAPPKTKADVPAIPLIRVSSPFCEFPNKIIRVEASVKPADRQLVQQVLSYFHPEMVLHPYEDMVYVPDTFLRPILNEFKNVIIENSIRFSDEALA